MHLLITGSSSFIGKALLALCDARGIRITGIDRQEPTRPDCLQMDIQDPHLADAIPEEVDAVIHLAAMSRDPDCRNRAKACFAVNVMGTLNLMEAALQRRARQFVFASTEWVYDRFTADVAKTEEDAIDPANLQSEYALSKLVSEFNLRQKFQHGFCPVTILRLGIIYGPRHDAWSAVESLLNGVASKDQLTVGAQATSRCFIHVSDIAEALLAAVGQSGFAIYNIQGERLVSLGEVIATSQTILQRQISVVETAPHTPSIRNVSGEKAYRQLGWRPRVDLTHGLQSVADFLQLPRGESPTR
ncbi:MAG: NAD(P)-dependent oxidoreductase [Magnetococcales bacterium]|nr:NAD(P)-dependent oxidoreductase [Magnetococcales bacterium]